MVRLSLANCPRFNFFFPQHQKVMRWRHPRKATTPEQKITRQSKDKIELYQGIDLTRNKILINVINDVLAGRFSTMEQKDDLHAQELRSWKTHNTC